MNATAKIRYSGSIAIIDLVGRITLADGLGMMREAIQREIQAGYKYVLLNLAGVSYVDSAGLGEMASAYIKLTQLAGKMKLVHAQQKVQSMLKLTGLSTLLTTYGSEAEALASFGVK